MLPSHAVKPSEREAHGDSMQPYDVVHLKLHCTLARNISGAAPQDW